MRFLWVVPALVFGLAGCGGGIPFLLPDTRTPADRARVVEPKCQDFSEEGEGPRLSPRSIDSVEPFYAYLKSGPVDRQAHLQGAKLHFKPLPGLSRESIARGLECHQARVVLGRASPVADDPYVLDGDWLAIEVDSEGDGFVVRIAADTMSAAQRVLDRARRFAAAARR